MAAIVNVRQRVVINYALKSRYTWEELINYAQSLDVKIPLTFERTLYELLLGTNCNLGKGD